MSKENKTYIGTTIENERVFITWTLTDDGNFSASGEYWNKQNTDMTQCGQCLDSIVMDFPESKQAKEIHNIWKKYDLNKFTGGSPKQEEVIRTTILPALEDAKKETYKHNGSFYKIKSRVLKAIDANKYAQYQDSNDILKVILDYFQAKALPKHAYKRYLQEDINSNISGYGAKYITIKPEYLKILLEGRRGIPNEYDFIKSHLSKIGRLVDPDYLVTNDEGDRIAYEYGTKWIKSEIPDDVITQIENWEEVSGGDYISEYDRLMIENKATVTSSGFNRKKNMNGWTLTIGEHVFDFFTGILIAEEPTASEIFDCLLRDAIVTEESIDELGYDFKEGLEVLQACQNTRSKLIELGFENQIDEL